MIFKEDNKVPGLITHYICGEAVFALLEGEMKDTINKYRQMYNVGTQGPDIFFYYLPGLVNKKLTGLGAKMHKGNFKLFMKGMAECIDETGGDLKTASIAYVCGYLTHYSLDYNTHPYIYYKTGSRSDSEPVKSLKYSVYHRNFETAIDVLMLKLVSGEKPSAKKLWELIKISKREAYDVANLIGANISSAYETPVSGKQVYKSFVYMMRLTRLLQSKGGKRKKLMEFAEGMTIGEKICSSLIHMEEVNDGIDYLNISKKPWFMPWDDKKVIDSSFTEMFEKAVADSEKMISAFHKFLKKEISIDDFLIITGNYSFATGLEFDDTVDFKFYDIVYQTN